MCIKDMLFYTAFMIKEHVQLFSKNGPKNIENEEMSFINYVCMLTDC